MLLRQLHEIRDIPKVAGRIIAAPRRFTRAHSAERLAAQANRPLGSVRLRVDEILNVRQLRGAIERDEIFVWYQPKRRIADGTLVGAEALVRWATPERGVIPAGEFIPVAEETGMIIELGRAVMRQVMRQLALWMERGL